MSMPFSGGRMSTSTKIRTPGPQLGNMTIDTFQEERTMHRRKSGSKYFPGTVTDKSMRIDEFDIVLAFKGQSSIIGNSVVGFYPSHMGTATFSNLAGIPYDRWWLYANARVVGVSKSHTFITDEGPGSITEFATHVGGTTSIINNGLYTIIAGSEIRLAFYDNVTTPDQFKKIFEQKSFMDGDNIRPVAVVEPYGRVDELSDLMTSRLSLLGGTEDEDPEGSEFFEDRDTLTGIVERTHENMLFTMMLGAALFSSTQGIDVIPSDVSVLSDTIVNRLDQEAIGNFAKLLQEDKDFSRLVASVLYSKSPSSRFDYGIKDVVDENEIRVLKTMQTIQNGAHKLLNSQKELVMWERKWVIGTAHTTSNPGEKIDLRIHRGCY